MRGITPTETLSPKSMLESKSKDLSMSLNCYLTLRSVAVKEDLSSKSRQVGRVAERNIMNIVAVLSTTVRPVDGVYEVKTVSEIPEIKGIPH